VQQVRVRTPRPRVKQIAVTIIVFYVCWMVYGRLVLGPLDKAASDAIKNMPQEEEDEEDSGSIFIPFPGTTKQLPIKPYRGSDPEWQAFIKFSKDQELAKKVREELAQFVRQLADKHPAINIRCGKGMKLRRYWLDVDFPTHPPPEFERSGIEITDDFIAWSTMPVDSSVVFRLRQVLWPSALVQSVWACAKVMVVDDSKRLARMFGFQNVAPPPNMDQLIAQHQAMIKASGLPSPNPSGPPKPKQPQTLGDSQKTMVPVSEKAGVPGKESEEEDNSLTKATTAIQSHFFRAISAFKLKFSQVYKPPPSFPPRGSILVTGLVELDSPRAWLVFDIQAAWDPTEKEFDQRSMRLKLRRMQMKKQGPLGGA